MITNIYKKGIVKAAATFIGLTASLFTMTSCDDFLDIQPQEFVPLEKFWSQKSDVDEVVAGCYSAMQTNAIVSRMYVWGEMRSENCINVGNLKDVSLERVIKEDINASNAYTYWGDFYNVINRCNTVMLYAPKVAEVDPAYSQSQLNAHLSEVITLRALCYFYLIRTFQNVPYTEEAHIDDTQRMSIPQTPFNEVLDKLIAQLEDVLAKDMAVEKYPATNAYSNTARVTKYTIYALLCEMYLWKQNYDKCISYANTIIEYKKELAEEEGYTKSQFSDWYGYPIIGTGTKSSTTYGRDFISIFSVGNSIESIFELTYTKGNKNALSNSCAAAFFGNRSDPGMVTFSQYVGTDQSEQAYNIFDKANKGLDARGYANFNIGSNNTGIVKPTLNGAVNVYAEKKSASVGSVYDKIGSNDPNKANVIIYRISDIMLLKAEAHALKGELEQAFELVDAVNKRSLMKSTYTSDVLDQSKYTSQEDMLDLVYQERERELMYEGKRYYDLVRRSLRDNNTEYLAEHVCNKDDKMKTAIQNKFSKKMNYIFWPVNLDEIKANPDLVQNDAFGSGENSSFKKVTE